jgi:hypothetical protein
LLEAAGPGRYRLELVGADRKALLGAPVASTGDIGDDDDRVAGHDDDGRGPEDEGSNGHKGLGKNELLSQLLQSNARMTASALHQVTAVLSGAAQLVTAAHTAGITSRPAQPVVQLAPVAAPIAFDVDDHADDDSDPDDADLDDDSGADPDGPGDAPAGGLPELVQYIIKQTVAAVAPLVVEKLASTFAQLPLGSLTDWRKAALPTNGAAPTPEPPQPHAHVTPATSTEHASTAPVGWTPPDTTRPPSSWTTATTSSPRWARQTASARAPIPNLADTTLAPVATMHSRSAIADVRPTPPADSHVARTSETPPAAQAPVAHATALHVTAPPLDGLVTAGAASQGPSTREAVPAEVQHVAGQGAPTPDHFTVVWNALAEPERMRAVKLIARLSPEARAALVEELSSLPLDAAVERARNIIRGRAPTT